MKINWKTPEAFLFDGKNFDELKKHFPQLEKYTFRTREDIENVQSLDNFHGYTVGWAMPDVFQPGDNFTEALPGMYLIKNDGPDKIITEEQFKLDYDAE